MELSAVKNLNNLQFLIKHFVYIIFCYQNLKAKLRTYGESCVNDWSKPCDFSIGLMCSTANNFCLCPNSISANNCDCPLNKWWNGTHCGNNLFFRSFLKKIARCMLK